MEHVDKAAIAAPIERQPNAALMITRNIARELSQRVRSTSALMADETTESSTEWANSSLGSFSRQREVAQFSSCATLASVLGTKDQCQRRRDPAVHILGQDFSLVDGIEHSVIP